MKILFLIILFTITSKSLAFDEGVKLYHCHFTGFLTESESVEYVEGHILEKTQKSNSNSLLELRLSSMYGTRVRGRVEFFDRVFGNYLVLKIIDEAGREEVVLNSDMMPTFQGDQLITISDGNQYGSYKLTCSHS